MVNKEIIEKLIIEALKDQASAKKKLHEALEMLKGLP